MSPKDSPSPLPQDLTLAGQVREALQSAGATDTPSEVIDKLVGKVVEYVRTHPYSTLDTALLVAELVEAYVTKRPPLDGLDLLTSLTKNVADEAKDRLLDEALTAEVGPGAPEAPPDSSTMYYYNSQDGTWRLKPTQQSSWLRFVPFGGGGLVAALSALIAAIVAAITMALGGLSMSQCGPTPASLAVRDDPGTVKTIQRPVGDVHLTSVDGPVERSDPSEIQRPVGTVTPTVPSGAPGSSDDQNWEAALQRERMQAVIGADMTKYNALVQQHLQVYRRRGVSPCGSKFFPQGCTR